MFDECDLQGGGGGGGAEAFDGGDAVAIVHGGEGQAAVDPHAVDDDGAGPALAMVAAFLGAGKPFIFTEKIEKGHARVAGDWTLGSVDGDGFAHKGLLADLTAVAREGSGGRARNTPKACQSYV